jgi:hypothetical protein
MATGHAWRIAAVSFPAFAIGRWAIQNATVEVSAVIVVLISPAGVERLYDALGAPKRSVDPTGLPRTLDDLPANTLSSQAGCSPASSSY